MRDYDALRQKIKDTPLSELINEELEELRLPSWAIRKLSGLALEIHIAFAEMDTDQVINACHHDYRLPDKLRQKARGMPLLINEIIHDVEEQDQENAAYYEADRRIEEMKAAY